MAGTTIDGLNSVTSLTAQDEVPVWDVEASGEPTKKITAQNMTASVKTLGSLVNTTEMNNALSGKQNTLTFDSTPTTGSTNPVTSGGIADAISQSTAIITQSYTATGESTPANSVKDYTFTISKSGYTPIGIVGIQILAGGIAIIPVSYYLDGSSTAKVRTLNRYTAPHTPDGIKITIAYKPN
jgi:hypothetical protein